MTHRARLAALAGPVYLELLAGVVAGIIDVLWVARLGGGAAAVAAVAVATNTENVLLGVVLMAAQGTTVLVSRAVGARDPAAVGAAVRGGWALCALLAPAVAVGGFLCREPLAALLLGGHGDPAAVRLAAGYFAVSLPGTAVFYAQNTLDGVFKGAGDTRTPMRLALLANGLILLLDPFLIHALGVRGAAVATVAGRAAALAAGLALLRRNPLVRRAATVPPAEPVAAALRRTAVTGAPMAADFLVRMAGTLTLVAIVARLGVDRVAAYGIATKAVYAATMGFYAVRQAASIHTAYHLGAGRDERRAIGRQALLLGAGLGLLAAVVLQPAAPWIMAAFGAEPGVAAAGTAFLRTLGPYLVLLACFIAPGGVLQGGGGAALLVRVTLVGTAVQLPLAYALAVPAGLGLVGVGVAMAVAAGLQCLAVTAAFTRSAASRRPGRAPADASRTPCAASTAEGPRPPTAGGRR
ncbi:MATE family efflux transporter [Actinacidiphila glaucinigra]|uniref:MATE family efflux transporter n=1 Tax=Actinacidiphila glaucinigra TaxID=235986 RepID=UPI0036ECA825